MKFSEKSFQAISLLVLSACMCAQQAFSASFEAVAVDVEKRLDAAQDELAKQRQEITQEKLPYAQSTLALENEVLSRKSQLDELRRVKDRSQLDLSKLEKEVNYLEKQDDFVSSMLNQFVGDFEGRLDISETPIYQGIITAGKLAAANANLTETEKREQQLAVIEAALDRIGNKLGGHSFPGEALGPNGVLTPGKFLAMGPSVFFSSSDGGVFGLSQNQLNAADPVVTVLPEAVGSSIAATVSSGNGFLPLDSSLGKAIKIASSKKTLSKYVEEGGVVGYVILGLGAFALLLTFFKLIEVGRFKVAEPLDVDFMIDNAAMNRVKDALDRAAQFGGDTASMFKTGIEHFGEKRGMIEELMFESILAARPKLERFLPFLAITAAAAPLLGLLGTVIGMIKTFQLITIFGTGDAKSLSSGISEALVTTALGLVIAIPVLVLHGMLSRMAKRKLGMLEQGAVAFVNGSAQHKQQPKHKGKKDEPVLA